MRREKNSLHFQGRKTSVPGMVSCAIGSVAWIIFIALAVYSSAHQGNAEAFIGTIGILNAVLALTGTVFAVRGFREHDVFYGQPVAGMTLNAVLFLIYFILYLIGMTI